MPESHEQPDEPALDPYGSYEIVNDDRSEGSDIGIRQGDVLQGFEVPIIKPPAGYPIPTDSLPEIKLELMSVVVVSQSCDLEQSSLESMVVAPLDDWYAKEKGWASECAAARDENREKAKGTLKPQNFKGTRKSIRQGLNPNLHLYYEYLGEPKLPWSVVNLRELLLVNVEYAKAFIRQCDKPRLRLTSPFREHFSQHVARYFMRVALDKVPREWETGAYVPDA